MFGLPGKAARIDQAERSAGLPHSAGFDGRWNTERRRCGKRATKRKIRPLKASVAAFTIRQRPAA
jgi:hypothetical protein